MAIRLPQPPLLDSHQNLISLTSSEYIAHLIISMTYASTPRSVKPFISSLPPDGASSTLSFGEPNNIHTYI